MLDLLQDPDYDGFNPRYDKAGRRISYAKYLWLKNLPDRSYDRIALDVIGQTEVSTVWLGMDHDYTEPGPPVIFETMVSGELIPGYERFHHYVTEEQARIGHETVCAELRTLLAQYH